MRSAMESYVKILKKKADQKKKTDSRLLEFRKEDKFSTEDKLIEATFIKFKQDKDMSILDAVKLGL